MQLPTELVFWLCIPGLLIILLFGWLIFTFRGQRRTTLQITGLGLSVTLDSSHDDEEEEREDD